MAEGACMNQILDNYLFEAFANASDTIFVYVTDMKQGITRWSDNAVNFFDLDGEYTYNTAEMWLENIHPDDREIYQEDISAVMNGLSAHHNCQYRVRNRYGEYIWVECRGSVSVDTDGEPTVFAGIMTWLDNQNKYDSLTHLMTSYELLRHSFHDSGILMLIGIDYFRDINSQHGVLYGNKILIRLSEILVREAVNATVYRFQGDEFVVYGKNMSSLEMAALFRRVAKKCKESEKESGLISFSVSAGITAYTPMDDVTKVLARAELCMNYAKEKSPTHMTIFSSEIEKKQTRRNRISEELLRCIKNDFKGFYLVYQPVYDNEGKRVFGCEALLRWKTENEEIGECYPNEFIPILERNGGIIEVGYFVMREAIRQAAIWQKRYGKIGVSFNVSYLQLEDSQFVPAIIRVANKYEVDTSCIVVELTESVFAADTILVNHLFSALKKNGIKVALDDFGTGSSSFWTLHKINVDIVKIDQAFIRGLEADETGIDYAIIESVGLMCRRAGFQTVAEGVETQAIWDKIKGFGFEALQGYLFSRPLEVEEVEKILN